jgi:hypothetical protein
LFGVYSNTENSLWIASDPDNLRSGSRTVFTVDGTQTAQINPYGIGVGSATPTSGTGITFPATQSASSDANTLDDYEEGTWTPTVTTSGLTSYTSSGIYTKIGRSVTVEGIVTLTNAGTASGSMEMTGLPFTISTNTAYGVARESASTGVIYFFLMDYISQTQASIRTGTNGGVIWTTGYIYRFSGTYLTST